MKKITAFILCIALSDSDDFSEENVAAAGIEKRFENDDFEKCY